MTSRAPGSFSLSLLTEWVPCKRRRAHIKVEKSERACSLRNSPKLYAPGARDINCEQMRADKQKGVAGRGHRGSLGQVPSIWDLRQGLGIPSLSLKNTFLAAVGGGKSLYQKKKAKKLKHFLNVKIIGNLPDHPGLQVNSLTWQIWILRLREGKIITQGHGKSFWKSLGLPTPSPRFLPIIVDSLWKSGNIQDSKNKKCLLLITFWSSTGWPLIKAS